MRKLRLSRVKKYSQSLPGALKIHSHVENVGFSDLPPAAEDMVSVCLR